MAAAAPAAAPPPMAVQVASVPTAAGPMADAPTAPAALAPAAAVPLAMLAPGAGNLVSQGSAESGATASALLRMHKDACGIITLVCANTGELQVDREVLCKHSAFFSDMLTACDDTGTLKVDESLADMELFLKVAHGAAPASTYDTCSSSCWNDFRRVLSVADKYDCPLVRERCEKMLLSRCLRGRMRCDNFRFQDPTGLGLEWLQLCQRHSLHDLGWFVAYDLGSSLAEGSWSAVRQSLEDVSDPELLKVMLEAVSDSVQRRAAEGQEGAGAAFSSPSLGPDA